MNSALKFIFHNREDFQLDSDRLSVYVRSESRPGTYHQVTVSTPKSKKGYGGTPWRRFPATCGCDAVTRGRGSHPKTSPKCRHIAATYVYFFS